MMRIAEYLWHRRRPWIVSLSGMFCLLAVGHYCWVVAGPGSGLWGPQIVCEPLKFNCGEVPTLGMVEHSFVICNAGRKALHVNVKAGCGSCSTVKLSKDEIAPGDKSILRIILNAARLKKGEFIKQVLVMSDVPRSPKVVLSLHGKAI